MRAGSNAGRHDKPRRPSRSRRDHGSQGASERTGLNPGLSVAEGDRALLVGVEYDDRSGQVWSAEASLDELAALAETSGLQVVGRTTQRLWRPHPATFIGSGKVAEVRSLLADTGANLVLVDHELTPRQERNLEAAFDALVIDRTALILDVFAQHARTREGRLQVELAQYEYRLPRLTRLWTHLARQAGGRAGGATGGVGVRGPGETQLEIDRREIRRRIAALRREIETVRLQRDLYRRQRRRAGVPVVALVGYTNAGKTTLLNAISDANAYVADQLFATLDPTTRRVALPSGRVALVTDTVGFIQRLPTALVAAFRATLEEIGESDLLLHIVDGSHPDCVAQAETVERTLADLGLVAMPMVVAINKVDRLLPASGGGAPRWQSALDPIKEVYPDAVPISARDGIGLFELLQAVENELTQSLVPVSGLVPYARGELLHELRTQGVLEWHADTVDGTAVRARVPRHLLGVLAPYVSPVGAAPGEGAQP